MNKNKIQPIRSRVVAIRHGNSMYNWAYDDPEYGDNPEADIKLVDAELSEKGLKQCEKASLIAD